MLVLLSPAKSLDLEAADPWHLTFTVPIFVAEAEALVHELQKLSQAELKSLLGVSDDLTKLNYQRFKDWDSPGTPSKACVLAFDGPAYKHLRAGEFTKQQAADCQSCLRILSGLYGLLQPLDLIKPYRLDMGRKLRNARGPNLYSHWTAAVTEQLNKELEGPEHEGSRFVVNCASQEYAKVVDVKKLTYPMYNVLFPGLPAVFAKQARGAMVRHIVRSGARTIKALQEFKGNNGEYRFDAAAAGGAEKLVFKKVAAGPGDEEQGSSGEGARKGGEKRGRGSQSAAPATEAGTRQPAKRARKKA